MVNNEECQDNVLSDELLKILDIQDPAKKKELCIQMATNTTTLVNKVIMGLAKKNMQMNNMASKEHFDQCIKQLERLHSKNIRGMTAQILERVFITHAEQQRVNEVRKLIYSSMFLKSVVICACEVQFFIQNVKEMQIYHLIELIDQPPFDLWRILNIFLKLYPDIPLKLNNQFREIEIRIICELAWKRGSSVIKIIDYMKKQASQEESKDASSALEKQK
jgi:hypothetical protein